MSPLLVFLLFLLFFQLAVAKCEVKLPTAATIPPEPSVVPSRPTRIIGGLPPTFITDIENAVTIIERSRSGDFPKCTGSLIAAQWVVTAASCAVIPNTYYVRYAGPTNQDGFEVDIIDAIKHEDWIQDTPQLDRHNIQLIQLARKIPRDPSPTPNPQPSPPFSHTTVRQNPSPSPAPKYNYMYVNTNKQFAMDDPMYLRVKGYGMFQHPDTNNEPVLGLKHMRFADLQTASCGDGFGNDGGRRLCTAKNVNCGPCFGDSGAPLYDVDQSGQVGVLVGIVTFGGGLPDQNNPSRTCTSRNRPVVYTAIAHYVDWIVGKVGRENLLLYQLPPDGISGVNLSRDRDQGLNLVARVSIITVSTLVMIGLIGFLLFTCILRHLRRKRKRWVEGMRQEESFIQGREKDAKLVDPFEGIVDEHKVRMSITTLGRAARKGATEFSARSIEAVRAILLRMDEEDFVEPRDSPEDAPDWLAGAWQNLFMAPSRRDLSQIHKVPTQRVVDDVLEGADKSVEPSLDSVAFKSARDDANLEAAWKRLEIKTSLRNIAESTSQSQLPTSPTQSLHASSPQASGAISTLSPQASIMGSLSLLGSRATESRKGSGLGSGKGSGRKRSGGKVKSPRQSLQDVHRTDTLLAAFASIDADAEQVAEETAVDPTALHALAKRPNLFAALRKKLSFGSGLLERSSSEREREGESARRRPQSPVVSAEGFDNPGPISPNASGQGMFSPSGSRGGGIGSPGLLSPSASVFRPLSPGASASGGVMSPVVSTIEVLAEGASAHREFTTRSASGFSANTITPDASQRSVGMNYFSDTYSISDSGSDDNGDDPTLFDQVRRYTTDRREEALPALRPLRTHQVRSFERLGTRPEPTRDVEEEEEIHEVDLTDFDPDDLFPELDIVPEGCDVGGEADDERELQVPRGTSRGRDMSG